MLLTCVEISLKPTVPYEPRAKLVGGTCTMHTAMNGEKKGDLNISSSSPPKKKLTHLWIHHSVQRKVRRKHLRKSGRRTCWRVGRGWGKKKKGEWVSERVKWWRLTSIRSWERGPGSTRSWWLRGRRFEPVRGGKKKKKSELLSLFFS